MATAAPRLSAGASPVRRLLALAVLPWASASPSASGGLRSRALSEEGALAVPGTGLPNCDARVAVPPMNGTFMALDLPKAPKESFTTDAGWNMYMKDDSCRYPLWGRTQTADCLRGAWFVVMGASSANIWMMQLANSIVPTALSTKHDNFNIDGVWTQMIDIIIEDGEVTYRKIVMDTDRKAKHARKGAHSKERDSEVLAEKFALISEAPAYSSSAIRITHFNAEYWDDVDLAVGALKADTAWSKAELAVTVQVGLWYVSSLSCMKWDQWCATRPEYNGIKKEDLLTAFTDGMTTSMGLLDDFCAPGGRTGQRGCAVASIDHCAWMKDAIWFDLYHAFNTTARESSKPHLRFMDIWSLTATLNVDCAGEHQTPLSTLWTWQVLLGGFCDPSLAAEEPIAIFNGTLCTASDLKRECKDYKEQGFKFDWECALAKPCELLPHASSALAQDQGCDAYMTKTGCDWTKDWSCPGQPAGQKGSTGNDGSLGYKCCCSYELWNGSRVNVESLAGAWQTRREPQVRGAASWPIAAGLATAAGALLAVAAAALVRCKSPGRAWVFLGERRRELAHRGDHALLYMSAE